MQHSPLARTGLSVSRIGFGAFKIGRNQNIKYPAPYDLPDEREVERLLNGVLDLGIAHIDTAPAYGLSEERIGRAIAHRRGEFVLSTKVGETFADGRSRYDFSAQAIRESVDRSRERLRTEVLDIVFIHSNRDEAAILNETDAVAALRELKDAGAIQAVGLSAKTAEGAQRSLAWADVLMVEYHAADRSMEAVIAEAGASGVGVVVKKGLASGRLPADEAIRFVLSNAAVSNMVIGSLNLDHLRANLAAAVGGP